MEVVHKEDNFLTLTCRRGEDIINALKTYIDTHSVKAAHITGLGSVDEVELAYYNLETKEYERHHLDEKLEIVNLTGNVSLNNAGETVIHIHGTFGRRDLSVIGGHVMSMQVSGVAELHLRTFKEPIHRRYDDDTGLHIMYPS